MTLFSSGAFMLHSGQESDWKIDCDHLKQTDIRTIAKLIAQAVGPFSDVYGIPSGGTRLAAELHVYRDRHLKGGRVLVVDDVLTSGGSMRETMAKFPGSIGAVIFARGPLPENVVALWQFGLSGGSDA